MTRPSGTGLGVEVDVRRRREGRAVDGDAGALGGDARRAGRVDVDAGRGERRGEVRVGHDEVAEGRDAKAGDTPWTQRPSPWNTAVLQSAEPRQALRQLSASCFGKTDEPCSG